MPANNFDEKTGRRSIWAQIDNELRALINPDTGKVRQEFTQIVECPVCDSNLNKPLFTKIGFDFVRCEECSTIFVNPQLKDNATIEYYRPESKEKPGQRASSAMWMDVLTNPNNQAWQIPYFEEALGILSHFIPERGKILDLGCSIGLFMEIAQKKSYQCTGLEPEPDAFEYARNRGLDVRQQTLSEALIPDNTCDAVTMFGVLEHLQHPKAVLNQVWNCLKPGGALMAIVPNVYSLAAMTLHDQARMFVGRNHLTYFSWKTLPMILENSGFVVKHLDTCLTALDSILNYWQFADPQGGLITEYLPPKLQEQIENPESRRRLEDLIYEFNLGLRLRIVAMKPT